MVLFSQGRATALIMMMTMIMMMSQKFHVHAQQFIHMAIRFSLTDNSKYYFAKEMI